MDYELAERWLANLESGEFQQTRSRLMRNAAQLCCLGVLCTTAGATWERDDVGDFRPIIAGIKNKDNSVLIKPIRELFGLDSHLHKLCWVMNDGEAHNNELLAAAGLEPRKHTFKEIAAFLRPILLEGKKLPAAVYRVPL